MMLLIGSKIKNKDQLTPTDKDGMIRSNPGETQKLKE
jgi:hypothetical protein